MCVCVWFLEVVARRGSRDGARHSRRPQREAFLMWWRAPSRGRDTCNAIQPSVVFSSTLWYPKLYRDTHTHTRGCELFFVLDWRETKGRGGLRGRCRNSGCFRTHNGGEECQRKRQDKGLQTRMRKKGGGEKACEGFRDLYADLLSPKGKENAVGFALRFKNKRHQKDSDTENTSNAHPPTALCVLVCF